MARESRPLSPEHARLRHEIAVWLRSVRGTESQVVFCGRLQRKMGDGRPAVDQYSKYEREEVDPPAYLLLAVREMVGKPQLALQESVERLEVAVDRVERILDVAAG